MRKIDFEKPDQEALNHSMLVQEHLKNKVNDHQGWLSFYDFMNFVLYKPTLGYYSTGTHKIGLGGDFTTAPEVSKLFGVAIANQLLPAIRKYKKPSILEIGAGSGKLAFDIINHLNNRNVELDYYYILEISGDLKERQKRTLSQLPKENQVKIRWLDKVPEEGIEGAVIANEVIDALPFERFKIIDNDILQIGITFKGSQLMEKERAASPVLKEAITNIENDIGRSFDSGSVSEIRIDFEDWFKSINKGLKSGIALFIDYGYARKDYYSSEIDNGNMICHFQNKAHLDPYIYPGLQDISASVDFSLLADSAFNLGYQVELYCHQADFLMSADILESINSETDDEERIRMNQQIKQLFLPNIMGESFKCMLLSKECNIEHLEAVKDLRHML
jgi:SAM-dependent MidA family methyltransferase